MVGNKTYKKNIMNKILAILFLIIFLIFTFLIIKVLIMKGILHFRLLKEIFPEKLKNVKFYSQSYIFKLNFDILIWYWVPFYYSKVPEKELTKYALKLHFKLKSNNKKLAIILLCFVIYFVVFWIVSTKLGT